jgi:hypothetical protein
VGDAEYTPQHPHAYAGRPGLTTPPWRRPPVVVDEPGIFVGGNGDEGRPRLVHWESISEIVRYETTVPGGHDVDRTDAIGLRLRQRPGVISVQRVLRGWRLDHDELAAAVARFASHVDVVEGPSQDPASGHQLRRQVDRLAEAVRAADDGDEDGVRRPADGEPLYGPRTRPAGTASPPAAGAEPASDARGRGSAARREPAGTDGGAPAYGTAEPGAPVPAYGTPEDDGVEYGSPDAGGPYVVKAGVSTMSQPLLWTVVGLGMLAGAAAERSEISLVLGIVGVAALIPMATHIRDARRGVVYFSADADGVYLGKPGRDPDEGARVSFPWHEISTVVVFLLQDTSTDDDGDRTTRWRQVVGVTTPDGAGHSGEALSSGISDQIPNFMVFRDFKLDRARLEAAVERYGDGVPIVNGPAVGEHTMSDLARGAIDLFRTSANPGQAWHRGTGGPLS